MEKITQEHCGSPSLEVFKSRMDVFLMTMLVATAGVIGFEIPWLVSSRKLG